jgi:hypothetical protein
MLGKYACVNRMFENLRGTFDNLALVCYER